MALHPWRWPYLSVQMALSERILQLSGILHVPLPEIVSDVYIVDLNIGLFARYSEPINTLPTPENGLTCLQGAMNYPPPC